VRYNDHPDYNDGTLEYDYSVLTLCSSLALSKTVAPVCLPEDGSGTKYEGQYHVVSGWGTTSSGGSVSQFLKETSVKSMPNSDCCSSPYSYSCGGITDVMMCAASPGTDSCQGDSGGPLTTNFQNGVNYVQTGVVSFGIGCAEANYPGVYARVSKVIPWITGIDSKTKDQICSL
jgi:secreted trypsin-like serine protease